MSKLRDRTCGMLLHITKVLGERGKANHLHKALLSSQGTYQDDHQFSFRLVPLGRLGQLALRNGGSPERGSSFSRGIFCSCGPIIASCHSTATTC